MPVTINDIAREAGVSRSTVSLVLQDSPLVAEDTRQRVRATIARLGYQPNRLAASLRSLRSHIVGLVVTDITYPHYAQMSVGVEDAVEGAGYSVIVSNSRESLARERHHIDLLRQYRAEGLLITPVQQDVSHLQALCREGYPFVLLGRQVDELAADYCGGDPYATMRALVAYLAGELGHRRIALLSGTQRTSTSLGRLAGWRDELAARGLSADDGLVAACRADRRGGEEGARELLQRGVCFTALACVNDLAAVGAIRALHLAGRRVPEDVSVAGSGGIADVSPPERPLTTMAEDHQQVGRLAGQLLLRRIAQRDRTPGERLVISAQLVVGETTAPVRP
jgi:LacI family transcriptional regulator